MSVENRFAPYHHSSERGRKLLLAILFVFCAITAFTGINQLILGSKPLSILIGRFGLALLLSYFVFKGSFTARAIFAVLSGTAVLLWLYNAIALALPKGDLDFGAVFLLYAGFYTLAAWAVFRSPPIQAYWDSLKPKSSAAAVEDEHSYTVDLFRFRWQCTKIDAHPKPQAACNPPKKSACHLNMRSEAEPRLSNARNARAHTNATAKRHQITASVTQPIT